MVFCNSYVPVSEPFCLYFRSPLYDIIEFLRRLRISAPNLIGEEIYAAVLMEDNEVQQIYRIGGEKLSNNYFKYTGAFADDRCVVRRTKDNKEAYINKKGKIVTPWFDSAKDFSEELAAVKKGAKWGFIDKNGVFVIKPRFDFADSFYEGLAAFQINTNGKEQWGFVNRNGKVVIEPKFGFVHSGFSGGFAIVSEKSIDDAIFGYINTEGFLISGFSYPEAAPFSEGLAAVSEDGKWGFIGTDGKFVIEPIYEYVKHWRNHHIKGGLEMMQGFSGGIVIVSTGNSDEIVVDQKGKCLLGCN